MHVFSSYTMYKDLVLLLFVMFVYEVYHAEYENRITFSIILQSVITQA